MRIVRFMMFLCVLLFSVVRTEAADAGGEKASAADQTDKASEQSSLKVKIPAEPKEKTDLAAAAEAPRFQPAVLPASAVGISAGDSLILASDVVDEYVVMETAAYLEEEDDDIAEEEIAEFIEEEGVYVFPSGKVVTIKDNADSGRRTYSWANFGLDKDHVKKKGFVVYADAGYKWVFLRKMGFKAGNYSMQRNFSRNGGTASVGFGYSFGEDVPLALEIDMGIGPRLYFNNTRTFGNTTIDMRQKLNIYNFDASIDYDIKNGSIVTPFLGINTGFALVGDRGVMKVYDAAGNQTAWGEYKRKQRVNLMGGLRLGAKVQIHKNVIMSAVAEYNYTGDVQPQQFVLSDGTQASTKRIKSHEMNLKLGVQMYF